MPLGQAIDEYLEWLELDRHRSPRTVSEYRADLDRFLEFAENAQVRRTAALDRELIRAYQRRVSRERKDTLAANDRTASRPGSGTSSRSDHS